MITVKEYRGHLRNWRALCEELGLPLTLPREKREPLLLIKAYEAWSFSMGEHLIGMFACALWDSERELLFCLRDQFGTKPFYYYLTEGGELLYGTMLRPILRHPDFRKELNETQLQLYLTFTYPAGEDTFFRGVKKLMPGHYMIFRNGKIEIHRYFRPTFRPETGKTPEDFGREINETMRTILQEVTEPWEKPASFLSGGVDSSYVLAMSGAAPAASCGYDIERFDESLLAEQTAVLLGRPFRRLVVQPEDFFAIAPFVMREMELPLGDASAVVFALGCRAVAAESRLCFSGEGSDEFFGGYNIYRNAERYGSNLPDFYVGNTSIMKEEEKQTLLQHYDPSVLPIRLTDDIYRENEGLDPLSKMMEVDIRLWLEGDIYLNVDKMSTAFGLEVRMPLTDPRMFEIASRIPADCRLNAEQNKLSFRAAASKVLPEEIAYRKKLGFIVPIRLWLADESLNGDVRRLLFGEISRRFFKPEAVRKMYDEYVGGNSDLWRKVWTLYSFLLWYEEYFEKESYKKEA